MSEPETVAPETAEPAGSPGKGPILLGVALSGAGGLLAATQPWLHLELAAGAAAFDSLTLTGQEINASLTPLAIAALAAALALTIAGPVLCRILGVVIALLGVGIAAITVTAASDWAAAYAGRLAEATGLSGTVQNDLVTHVSSTVFVWVAIAAGILALLCGLAILLVSGRWRTGGRKYQKSGARGAGHGSGDDNHDRITDWDDLSGGTDPTGDEPSDESPEWGGTR